MEMLSEYRALGKRLVALYCGFIENKNAVKELKETMEQVQQLDNPEIANRAQCFIEGIDLLKKTYIDIDSGNDAYVIDDYDYEKLEDALRGFINFYYGGITIFK